MRTIVIYHAHCGDGFCAAWLFSKAFPDAEYIEYIEYIACSYGEAA